MGLKAGLVPGHFNVPLQRREKKEGVQISAYAVSKEFESLFSCLLATTIIIET